jgi:hypothetical protein
MEGLPEPSRVRHGVGRAVESENAATMPSPQAIAPIWAGRTGTADGPWH